MEPQVSTGAQEGIQTQGPQLSTGEKGVRTQGDTGQALTSNPTRLAAYILRATVVILTFISAIVMGVANQSKTVVDTISGLTVTASVKSADSSAFIYFIVINVLAFLYSSASLAISVAKRANMSNLAMPLAVADQLMAVLLFSCNGAALAINVVADQGIDTFGWGKFCETANKFCGCVTASIVLSMFASLANLLLMMLSIVSKTGLR